MKNLLRLKPYPFCNILLIAVSVWGDTPTISLNANKIGQLGNHRFVNEGKVQRLEFTYDGTSLFAVNSQEACLWELETGRKEMVFRMPSSILQGAISQNGETVILSDNGNNLHIFDAKTGECLHKLVTEGNRAFAVSLTKDGNIAATGGGDDIFLWDVHKGQILQKFQHEGGVRALAFSPDGDKLACAGELRNPIRIYTLNGESEPITIDGSAGSRAWLSFSSDGKLLSGSCEIKTPRGSKSSFRTWDTTSGEIKHNISGTFSSGSFHPNGKMVAARGIERQSALYHVTTGQQVLRLPISTDVGSVAFSPDATLFAMSQGELIRLWSIETWEEIEPGSGHTHSVQTVAFCPSGKQIATGDKNGTLILWSWPEAQELHRIEGIGSHWGVQHLRFSPDGRTLGATAWVNGGDTFYVFDLEKGSLIHQFGKAHQGNGPIAFRPDGQILYTGQSNGRIALWESQTGKFIREVETHDGGIHSVWPAREHPFLWWAGEYQGLGLMDQTTGEARRRLENGSHHSSANLQLSPSEDWIAIGNTVWDLDSGKIWIEGREAPAAFSPDSRFLVSAPQGKLELWDLQTRQKIYRFDSEASAAAFSPDGTVLVATNGALPELWDMTGRLHKGTLRPLHATTQEMDTLWQRLRSPDPWEGHLTAWALAATGGAGVNFLQQHLHPAKVARARKIQKFPLPERVQASRAIAALQRNGSDAALDLLETLSGGASGAAVTQDAKQALIDMGRTEASQEYAINSWESIPVKPVPELMNMAAQFEFLATHNLIKKDPGIMFYFETESRNAYSTAAERFLESDLPLSELVRGKEKI
jgi:WD40 repeat protein